MHADLCLTGLYNRTSTRIPVYGSTCTTVPVYRYRSTLYMGNQTQERKRNPAADPPEDTRDTVISPGSIPNPIPLQLAS